MIFPRCAALPGSNRISHNLPGMLLATGVLVTVGRSHQEMNMSSTTTLHLSSSDDSAQKNLRRHIGHVVDAELARRRGSQRTGRPLILPSTGKRVRSES